MNKDTSIARAHIVNRHKALALLIIGIITGAAICIGIYIHAQERAPELKSIMVHSSGVKESDAIAKEHVVTKSGDTTGPAHSNDMVAPKNHSGITVDREQDWPLTDTRPKADTNNSGTTKKEQETR